MTKLSDTQAILLSGASQRESGSLLPIPMSLKPGGGIAKALDALISRGLAEERETSDPAAVRRTDGDVRLGLFATTAGLVAIGIKPEGAATGKGRAPVEVPAGPSARTSKTAAVLTLLGRPAGATLPELIEATGWLPHTTRAALTGLRKKGHVLDRSKRDDATCYRLVSAA